jgi:hypothetical protein
MNGHRQAAVILHNVSAADQNFILSKLNTADQEHLRNYLNELTELGFEVDHPYLHDAQSRDETTGSKIIQSQDSAFTALDANDILRSASVEDLYSLLENEPNGFIVQVMSLEACPSIEKMLAKFEPRKRITVRNLYENRRKNGPALEKSLTNLIVSRLPKAAAFDATNSPQKPIRTITTVLKKVKSWIQ